MAWTQTDIDALKAALKSGIRRVVYSDRSVEYQDVASMIRALRLMEAEVAGTSSATNPSRTILAQHARGV